LIRPYFRHDISDKESPWFHIICWRSYFCSLLSIFYQNFIISYRFCSIFYLKFFKRNTAVFLDRLIIFHDFLYRTLTIFFQGRSTGRYLIYLTNWEDIINNFTPNWHELTLIPHSINCSISYPFPTHLQYSTNPDWLSEESSIYSM